LKNSTTAKGRRLELTNRKSCDEVTSPGHQISVLCILTQTMSPSWYRVSPASSLRKRGIFYAVLLTAFFKSTLLVRVRVVVLLPSFCPCPVVTYVTPHPWIIGSCKNNGISHQKLPKTFQVINDLTNISNSVTYL